MWFIEYITQIDEIFHEGPCGKSEDHSYKNYTTTEFIEATKDFVCKYINNDGSLNSEGVEHLSTNVFCGCYGCRKTVKVIVGNLTFSDKNIKNIYLTGNLK